MSFLSLGSGFVNAAVERQKENRDESRERRKLAMEVFLKDTMPRIRAAQEKDNKFASDLNSMMSDSYYAGKPELAFYSKKWQERTGQDEMAFRAYARTNQLPEEVTAAARAKLAQDFNIDPNTNQLSWKQIPPTIPPAQPQGRKPTFMDRLLTRGDAQQDIQRGTSEIAAMVGVDPNAPTMARSEGLSIPGSFESKDPEQEKLKSLALQLGVQNFDNIRDPAKFMVALRGGDQKQIDTMLQDPKFFISKQEQEQSAATKDFRATMLRGIVSGDIKADALQDIFSGNADQLSKSLMKNLKTDEEKAAAQAKLDMIKTATGGLDNPQAIKLLRALGLLDSLPISKAQLDAAEAEANAALERQLSVEDRIMRQIANTNLPADQQIPTSGPVPQVGTPAPVPPPPAAVEPPPAQPTPEPEGPVTAEEVDALLRSRGSLTFGETSARQSEDTAAAIDAAAPMPAGFNEEEATQRFRSLFGMGDSTTEPKQDKKTKKERTDFVMNASPEEIQKEDPVQFLFDSRTVKNKKRREEIASSIRATPAILAKANNDERYGSLFNDVLNQYVFPYAPEAASLEEAQQKYEPYSFVIVDGTIQLIGPK